MGPVGVLTFQAGVSPKRGTPKDGWCPFDAIIDIIIDLFFFWLFHHPCKVMGLAGTRR